MMDRCVDCPAEHYHVIDAHGRLEDIAVVIDGKMIYLKAAMLDTLVKLGLASEQ